MIKIERIMAQLAPGELLKSAGQFDPPPHIIEGPATPIAERVKEQYLILLLGSIEYYSWKGCIELLLVTYTT